MHLKEIPSVLLLVKIGKLGGNDHCNIATHAGTADCEVPEEEAFSAQKNLL